MVKCCVQCLFGYAKASSKNKLFAFVCIHGVCIVCIHGVVDIVFVAGDGMPQWGWVLVVAGIVACVLGLVVGLFKLSRLKSTAPRLINPPEELGLIYVPYTTDLSIQNRSQSLDGTRISIGPTDIRVSSTEPTHESGAAYESAHLLQAIPEFYDGDDITGELSYGAQAVDEPAHLTQSIPEIPHDAQAESDLPHEVRASNESSDGTAERARGEETAEEPPHRMLATGETSHGEQAAAEAEATQATLELPERLDGTAANSETVGASENAPSGIYDTTVNGFATGVNPEPDATRPTSSESRPDIESDIIGRLHGPTSLTAHSLPQGGPISQPESYDPRFSDGYHNGPPPLTPSLMQIQVRP